MPRFMDLQSMVPAVRIDYIKIHVKNFQKTFNGNEFEVEW